MLGILAQIRPTLTRSDYLPEFGRVVQIREYDRPMSTDDVETAQTIRYMDDLATADAEEPAVYIATCEALDASGLDHASDPLEIARAFYWYLKRTIQYVPTPGTSPLVDQTLIAPTATLAMPEPIGDCPQFSMLAAAMFRVCCIPCYFVTIAAEPASPEQWSHVYNTVEVRPGVYLPFDSSNGPEPGAEYAHPFKRRVWPSLNPSPCRGKETAAQMVRTAKQNGAHGGMRNQALRRGMGRIGDIQCDADGNCYDSEAGSLVYSPTDASTASGGIAGDQVATGTYASGYADQYAPGGSLNPSLPSGAAPAPAPSSSGGIFSTLLNDAASIGTSIIKASTQQKPYYITGPNGQQVLYNPNTGGTVAASSVNPTVLLFGALGIGLVLLMSASKK